MEKNIKVYWLCLIIIIIISIFIFIETAQDDSDLVSYFSFAGSVTSLVLGLVAIFYSIVSNQQSSENFGKLKDAVTKIEEGAETMKNITESINSRLDKISDDIIKFATKGKDTQVATTSDSTTETPIQSDDKTDLPDEMADEEGKEEQHE